MIGKQIVLAAALAITLAGCGSAPPAPADRFYRLQPTSVGGNSAVPKHTLRSVRADSLYAERPIIHVRSDDPRQLRQYHYHLWLYPPADTVRDFLSASLGSGREGGILLDVRIAGFERVLDGKASFAQAELQVVASGPGGIVLERRYAAREAAGDDSFSAFAAAMESALRRISGELARDLAQGAGSVR
jgi:ABC-type uncharacterized transport system auxiliary subunit